MRKLLFIIFFLCITLFLSAQTTWHVYNGDSIQAVINAADNGDEVIVYTYGGGGQGTYAGFDYIRKNLNIHSQHPNAHPIIDGGNSEVIVDMTEINQLPNAAPELNGFKIIGRNDAVGVKVTDFQGLYVDIENNIIDGVGTAIFLEENLGRINVKYNQLINNDIAYQNQETDNSAASFDVFDYNTVHDNNNAGLLLGRCSYTHASYNLFYDNGISIHLNNLSPELELYQSTITKINPINNHTGIASPSSSSLTVINSIIYGNDSQIDDLGGDITVTYSDIEDGYTGTGNFDSDPYFCMESHYEFKLMEGSPCIDTGAINQTDPGDGTRIDIGYCPTTTDIKFCKGNHWNWVSFPRLDRDDNDPVNAPPILDDYLSFPFDLELKGIISTLLTYDEIFEEWSPPLFNIQSTGGFKLNPEETGEHYLPSQSGAMRLDQSDDWQIPTMNANSEYFIGYWIPHTKNITEAFGDLFDDVYSVQAEDWFYKYSVFETPSSSTAKKNMVYGKAYIVVFNTTVADFQWNENGGISLLSENKESENFTYTDLPSYEAIDILNIPEEVIEIGVFEDETCVGAVVVEDSDEQVLAYTSSANRIETPLTFEIVTSCRQGNQAVTSYKVLDERTGVFEERPLISGQQKNAVITFYLPEDEQEENQELTSVILNSNYPNPFNPTTNISFFLPDDKDIELAVYNLKGQKVCLLARGRYLSGEHSLIWDGIDDKGKPIPSGVYLYKLTTDNENITHKMIILK